MKLAFQNRISMKDILAGAALALTVFGGAFALTLSGCSSSNNSTSTVTFTQVYNDILSQSCVTCHAPGRPGHTNANGITLDFSTQTTAYSTLFNTASSVTSPGCSNFAYVTASNPGASYLVAVEVQSYNTTSGSCTPINSHLGSGSGYISDVLGTELVNWVNGGALNN